MMNSWRKAPREQGRGFLESHWIQPRLKDHRFDLTVVDLDQFVVEGHGEQRDRGLPVTSVARDKGR